MRKTLDEATAADAEDQFSVLPDCLIHNILLFLSMHNLADAARTCVLSKRWNNLRSTLPFFDSFLYPSFDLFVKMLNKKQPFSDIDLHQEYLKFLESFIQPRLENITSIVSLGLPINFPNIEALAPLMDHWLHMAVERNVSELYFSSCLIKDPIFVLYSVPQVVFLCSTLKMLKLWDIKLDSVLDINLPRLQNLDCCRVLGLDAEMVQKLISHSTKRLHIVSCDQLGNIIIIKGVPSLKQVTFSKCNGLKIVEIHAPKLDEFSFNVALNNKSELSELKLDACTSLRVLRLCLATMFFQNVTSLLSNIEVLALRSCYSKKTFMIPIKNLKELNLTNCINFSIPGININPNEFLLSPPPETTCIHPIQIHLQFSLQNRDIFWWCKFKKILTNSFNTTLKFALYCPNSFTIIHNNVGDVSLNSLFLNEFASKDLVICISSRSYSFIVDDLLLDNCSTTLSVVCPNKEPIEVLSNNTLNFQRGSRLYSVPWWDIYGGFEICKQPINKNQYLNFFLKAYLVQLSVDPYQITVFKLYWWHF